eukprot:GHVU01215799.1.p2 GENE.GHVU01215799.1~~GHVU01215799.1.p2  ORF type:complete len:191 (-),score=19.11 GHVU01215799.1:892-1464(-)
MFAAKRLLLRCPASSLRGGTTITNRTCGCSLSKCYIASESGRLPWNVVGWRPAKSAGQARTHKAGSTWKDDAERIPIVFVLRDGSKKTVEAPVGSHVLEVAHRYGIEIEGACEASLACSTCHVIVDADTYERLPEPSEREEDLLDLAPCLTETSRLCCQLYVSEELRGAEFTLPPMTRNFYVDGHVPDTH